MATSNQIKFDLKKYEGVLAKKIVPIVSEALNELYLDIQQKSPVDTGAYISWLRNEGVQVTENEVKGKVSNMGNYSEKVEYGWRSTPVNRHLRSGEIYFDIGAKPFMRALPNIQKKFISNLKSKLG